MKQVWDLILNMFGSTIAIFPWLSWFVLLVLFCNVSFGQPTDRSDLNEHSFRAAIVKANITPSDSQWLLGYGPRKSTGVLDSIYHRIVILDDGHTQFILVSTDICLISPVEYDRVATKLEKQPIYSVYPDHISGHLEQFRELLGNRILDANRKILSTTNDVQLTTGSLNVEIPRKSGLGWPPEMKKYARKTKAGVNMVVLPLRFLKINEDVAIWLAGIHVVRI